MNTFTQNEKQTAHAIRVMAYRSVGNYSNHCDRKAAIVALLLEAVGQELDAQGIDRDKFLTKSEE
ncbi:MAG: hypothetical protein KGI54_08800 [Pseudomonadota bacterium]|nr:hypothetical protein [Pseudomonadota bacterium]